MIEADGEAGKNATFQFIQGMKFPLSTSDPKPLQTRFDPVHRWIQFSIKKCGETNIISLNSSQHETVSPVSAALGNQPGDSGILVSGIKPSPLLKEVLSLGTDLGLRWILYHIKQFQWTWSSLLLPESKFLSDYTDDVQIDSLFKSGWESSNSFNLGIQYQVGTAWQYWGCNVDTTDIVVIRRGT